MTSDEEIQWLRDRLAAEKAANADLRQENARLERVIDEVHSNRRRAEPIGKPPTGEDIFSAVLHGRAPYHRW